MMNELEWAVTVGILAANVDPSGRHILATAMRRHPNAPWQLALQGLHAQGYNVAWAMSLFDGDPV